MNIVDSTIETFERLRENLYLVEVIDLGISFTLSFEPRHYHHLVGLHHLTDVSFISSPTSTERFYKQLKRGSVNLNHILESDLFPTVVERFENFYRLEEILAASDAKIIVGFNRHRAGSLIDAVFYLYQRDGNALLGEPLTYYHLFIGLDSETGQYFPSTFIVEHSKLYANGQDYYDCKISSTKR